MTFVSRYRAYHTASLAAQGDGYTFNGRTLWITGTTAGHREVTVRVRPISGLLLEVEYTVFYDVSLNDYRAVRR